MKLNVQFGDDTEKSIIAYFGGPQDEAVYKNVGVVLASDERWKAF